jgi:hypothetical protein
MPDQFAFRFIVVDFLQLLDPALLIKFIVFSDGISADAHDFFNLLRR